MKKTIGIALFLIIPCLFGCNNNNPTLSETSIVSIDDKTEDLGEVTNFRYENLALYFDKVKNATNYLLEIAHDNEIVFSKDISITQYDIETLNLFGTNKAYVTAYNDTEKSKKAELEFTITNIDRDTIYEGEHGLLNYGDKNSSNYRNNSLAHNGAYAGGIDDCGNGLHFDHFSYTSGERDLEIYYTTEYPGSFHTIYVNGAPQAKAVYTEKTGWGAVDMFNARKVTVKISLNIGWNNIELVKNGIASDNPEWGGFAEIDYIVLKGTGKEYVVDQANTMPVYKLQGEMGTAIKWDEEHEAWTTKNPAKYYEHASNFYMLGNIDNEGEGVEMHVNVPKKGYYRIQMAYAHDNNPSDIETFATITTSEAPRLRVKLPLTTRTGWGEPTLSEYSDNIELAQDGNYIYIKKSGNTGSFEIDYILLSYVGEIS